MYSVRASVLPCYFSSYFYDYDLDLDLDFDRRRRRQYLLLLILLPSLQQCKLLLNTAARARVYTRSHARARAHTREHARTRVHTLRGQAFTWHVRRENKRTDGRTDGWTDGRTDGRRGGIESEPGAGFFMDTAHGWSDWTVLYVGVRPDKDPAAAAAMVAAIRSAARRPAQTHARPLSGSCSAGYNRPGPRSRPGLARVRSTQARRREGRWWAARGAAC
jgi:hypothetical protein